MRIEIKLGDPKLCNGCHVLFMKCSGCDIFDDLASCPIFPEIELEKIFKTKDGVEGHKEYYDFIRPQACIDVHGGIVEIGD